jgi:hypothetical protein
MLYELNEKFDFYCREMKNKINGVKARTEPDVIFFYIDDENCWAGL